MTEDVPYHIDRIDRFVGREIGTSAWLTVDQERIDAFARTTDDFNPLHVDAAWAKSGPFGGTIAHGFLTLSLLTRFAHDVGLFPAGVAYVLNYGFDRVRFMAPVRAGRRIRNRVVLTRAAEKPGGCLLTTRNTVEIEDEPRPALVAFWIGFAVRDEGQGG